MIHSGGYFNERMELPHREKAFISREKIRDYLLSRNHPVGRSKAIFFQSLGYNNENEDLFLENLLKIAISGTISQQTETEYGTKYSVDGTLATLDSQPARIRTVWIIEKGSDEPRLVTAYPL